VLELNNREQTVLDAKRDAVFDVVTGDGRHKEPFAIERGSV
jgi:hypothetical protein